MKLFENLFWRIFPYIPLILFLGLLSFLINHYYRLTPRENIIKTVGTVIGYQEGGTSMRPAIIVFEVGCKKFSIHTSDNYKIGEKFIVEYEKKNPNISRVRLDMPIFLKYEKTNITIGYVVSFNPNYFKKISFNYYVDGLIYEQSYEPKEDSEIKYPELKVGKKYYVKYWVENPKRAIILLDKPSPAPMAQE